MLFGRQGLWKMSSVDLGKGVIKIPVFDRSGTELGPTVLVTAGIDGDEYAGIEAAYALGTMLANKAFRGRVVILPCTNLPGFFAQTSENPLDGQFPKSVGIGRVSGTSSERLMHWVFSSYAKEATMWIDLHSGALSERLNPFMWAWPSGKKDIDARMETFFKTLSHDLVVFDRGQKNKKIHPLTKHGCGYVMSEAGGRAERSPETIQVHLTRVTNLLRSLGLLPEEIPTGRETKILHRIAYLQAPYDGIWYPHLPNLTLTKQTKVGLCSRLDKTGEKALQSPTTGTVLWSKETMAMRKGDILLAVAW